MDDRHAAFSGESEHVAIDDHSRIAFAQTMPRVNGPCAAAFLDAALANDKSLGIPIRGLLTDNGPSYRSREFNRLCKLHYVKHRRTRPCTLRTNAKAERFIQTAIREWGYARILLLGPTC